MTKKLSEKYNDACLKIFSLLLLLSEGIADFSDVINIFADEDGYISPNAHVTLNKFLNTVKIFGVQVKKSKSKYYISHIPFGINFTQEELAVIGIIRSALYFLPKGVYKTNINNLLENIQKRFDGDSRKLDGAVRNLQNYDLLFYFVKNEKIIEQCERFCMDGYKLTIIYTIKRKQETIICCPKELKYSKKDVCLVVNHVLSGQLIEIPIDSIVHVEQIIGSATDSKVTPATVVFKLKGDLAKRYTLREWERSEGLDADGNLTIINAGEDFDILLKRLFRYDSSCVVVSPKSFRDRMVKLINDTLNNY